MNRQRGLIGLILYAIAAVAVVAAIGTVIWKIQHWKNAAWREEHALVAVETARADAAEAAIIAANRETNRIRQAWAAESVKAEAQAIQARRTNEQTFAALKDRARLLPAGRTVAVSGAVAGLLDDAARSANANATAPAPSDPAGADAVPYAAPAASVVYVESELVDWIVTAAMAYADARNQWGACIEFYERLRAQ